MYAHEVVGESTTRRFASQILKCKLNAAISFYLFFSQFRSVHLTYLHVSVAKCKNTKADGLNCEDKIRVKNNFEFAFDI